MTDWGTEIELERHRRIKVSVWAYAYEFMNISLVDDHIFDAACYKVNKALGTGNKVMDDFFKNEFEPYTGSWIHRHPGLMGIKDIYNKWYIPKQLCGQYGLFD